MRNCQKERLLLIGCVVNPSKADLQRRGFRTFYVNPRFVDVVLQDSAFSTSAIVCPGTSDEPSAGSRALKLLFRSIHELGHGETLSRVGFAASDGDRHRDRSLEGALFVWSHWRRILTAPGNIQTSSNSCEIVYTDLPRTTHVSKMYITRRRSRVPCRDNTSKGNSKDSSFGGNFV